jgi:hypothetical protein
VRRRDRLRRRGRRARGVHLCEDAERFIEEVWGDEPEMAAKLRIEERELGGTSSPNCVTGSRSKGARH